MTEARLYYTPPSDEIFSELKEACIKIWKTYDDTYGYATDKVNEINEITNVSDNFMYIVAKFDHSNQIKLSLEITERVKVAVRDRMIDGGTPAEYIYSILI